MFNRKNTNLALLLLLIALPILSACGDSTPAPSLDTKEPDVVNTPPPRTYADPKIVEFFSLIPDTRINRTHLVYNDYAPLKAAYGIPADVKYEEIKRLNLEDK